MFNMNNWWSDRKNNSLYNEIGKVKNNILTSHEISNNVNITVSRVQYDTVLFLYTRHEVDNVNTLKHCQTWNLTDSLFKNVKYIKTHHRTISKEAHILQKLFSTIPKVHNITVNDYEEIDLFYSPEMQLQYIKNENNVLHFHIIYSGDLHDLLIRSENFICFNVKNFDQVNSDTTILVTSSIKSKE